MSTPQPNYYAIIPANVRYSRDLEPNAKLLYGELTALAHSSGYCWASNQYFADLYGVDERTIKRWFASLTALKFIYIKTVKKIVDGTFKWDRKIFISPEVFKEYLRRDKNAPDRGDSNKDYEGTKMSRSKGQKCPHINTSSSDEEENNTKGAAAPCPALSLFSFFLEELKKHVPEILEMPDKKTAKAFEKLLEMRTDEEIRRVITFAMQDEFWRQHVHSPTYLKAKYAKLLTKMNALSAKAQKPVPATDNETSNRDFINEIKSSFSGKEFPSGCWLEILESGVVIHNGRDKEGLRYTDTRFKEIITNKLRTWGVA